MISDSHSHRGAPGADSEYGVSQSDRKGRGKVRTRGEELTVSFLISHSPGAEARSASSAPLGARLSGEAVESGPAGVRCPRRTGQLGARGSLRGAGSVLATRALFRVPGLGLTLQTHVSGS